MYLDHACDITYNSELGYLVVAHGIPNVSTISYIDAETLELVDTFKISQKVYGVAYNAANNNYFWRGRN